MTVSESRRGLERTVSQTSTKVSTSAKVAVRKMRGGRIKEMKVLVLLDGTAWTQLRGSKLYLHV